jgi:hypothetical protein
LGTIERSVILVPIVDMKGGAETMRTKGSIVGAVVIVAMLAVSSAAFIQNSHPVAEPQTTATAVLENCPPGAELASSGATGVPSSCAEVHASALAAGKLSREQYQYAQAQLVALAAHASATEGAVEVIPAIATEKSAAPAAQCDWTKGSCEPTTDK